MKTVVMNISEKLVHGSDIQEHLKEIARFRTNSITAIKGLVPDFCSISNSIEHLRLPDLCYGDATNQTSYLRPDVFIFFRILTLMSALGAVFAKVLGVDEVLENMQATA